MGNVGQQELADEQPVQGNARDDRKMEDLVLPPTHGAIGTSGHLAASRTAPAEKATPA